MSAFTMTWSRARAAFGADAAEHSTPLGDNDLARLLSLAGAATPGTGWQGAASDAYLAEHLRQGATLSRASDLDALVSAEIARSTGVVAVGRRNLDDVRDWVLAAAAATPPGAAGELIRQSLASKGIEQIGTIVAQSADQLAAIGDRLRGLGADYDVIV